MKKQKKIKIIILIINNNLLIIMETIIYKKITKAFLPKEITKNLNIILIVWPKKIITKMIFTLNVNCHIKILTIICLMK